MNDALASFRAAVKIKPDYTRAIIETARLLDKQNDSAGAIAAHMRTR